MSYQPLDQTDIKYAALVKFLEDNKDAYIGEDEKVRRGKLSIDSQLIKFYNRFESDARPSLETLCRSILLSQESNIQLLPREITPQKAYHNSKGLKFTARFKQADLPAEFSSLVKQALV